MKRFYSIINRITVILTGLIWGAISFFWLGYSVLTLGNFIEEPGSLDYEYQGNAMRIYGLIFLFSMILGGIILGIYIFALRG